MIHFQSSSSDLGGLYAVYALEFGRILCWSVFVYYKPDFILSSCHSFSI